MARFCPLFSGSSGNCTYVGAGGHGVLVDAGVSARRIETALRERDIDPASISAVFVTHEHSDHIGGLRVFTKRYGCRVYASTGTLAALDESCCLNTDAIAMNGRPVEEAGMVVKAFRTSHDSRESVGFCIWTPDERRVAVATDTGRMTNEIRDSLAGCDAVLIESNHDVDMLKNGGYPHYLKRRILADTGHLSNAACAAELPLLAQSGVTRFWLGHLSRENNRPELAYQTALRAFTEAGLRPQRDFLLNVAPPAATAAVMVL